MYTKATDNAARTPCLMCCMQRPFLTIYKSQTGPAGPDARWMMHRSCWILPVEPQGIDGQAKTARKPSPAQKFSTCPERERKIALWRRRSNRQVFAPAPYYPVVMAAEMIHGLARALSDGQAEAQGEYDAKSILLTGGAGFIASHVVIRLVHRYPEAKVSCTGGRDSHQCGSKDSLETWALKLPNEARTTKQL